MCTVRKTICSCRNDTYNKTAEEWICCNCGKRTIRTYHNRKLRDIKQCLNYDMLLEHCTPTQCKQVENINSRNYLIFVQGAISGGIVYITFKNEYTYESFIISSKGKVKSL